MAGDAQHRYKMEFRAAAVVVLRAQGGPGQLPARLGVGRATLYKWSRNLHVVQAAEDLTEEDARELLLAVDRGEYEPRHGREAAEERRLAEAEAEKKRKALPKMPARPRGKKGSGRIHMLEDPANRDKLKRALTAMVPIVFIAEWIGVEPAAVRTWLRDARNEEGTVAKWAEELMEAQLDGVIAAQEMALDGAPGSQHALTVLRRRFPGRFTERVEVQTHDSKAAAAFTRSELRALAALDTSEDDEEDDDAVPSPG